MSFSIPLTMMNEKSQNLKITRASKKGLPSLCRSPEKHSVSEIKIDISQENSHLFHSHAFSCIFSFSDIKGKMYNLLINKVIQM